MHDKQTTNRACMPIKRGRVLYVYSEKQYPRLTFIKDVYDQINMFV